MKRNLSFLIIITLVGGFAYFIFKTFDSSQPTNSESNTETTSYTEVNQLDGVTMQVVEESITPIGLSFQLENSLDREFTYGEPYLLEQKINGVWYEVPIATDEDYGFVDIGYILPANDSSERDIDWEWLYGELEPGKYRLLKEVLDVHEAGEVDYYPLSAEFTLQP